MIRVAPDGKYDVLADRYGRRRMFQIGLVLSAIRLARGATG